MCMDIAFHHLQENLEVNMVKNNGCCSKFEK